MSSVIARSSQDCNETGVVHADLFAPLSLCVFAQFKLRKRRKETKSAKKTMWGRKVRGTGGPPVVLLRCRRKSRASRPCHKLPKHPFPRLQDIPPQQKIRDAMHDEAGPQASRD